MKIERLKRKEVQRGLISKFGRDETYTGTLVYAGETYRFVFYQEKLKLLPNIEDNNPLGWLFDLKKLPDGSYTWKTPPRIEEDLLVGNCYETGNKIIFLPKKNAFVLRQDSLLLIDLTAYIIFQYERSTVGKISFYGPEIDCIHPLRQALDYKVDAEKFVNNGIFEIKARDFDFTTTPTEIFAVDGKSVGTYFGISREITTRVDKAPLILSSNLVFEFQETSDWQFVLRLWYIAKEFLQFMCRRKNICLDNVELSAPDGHGKYDAFATLYVIGQKTDAETSALTSGCFISQWHIAGVTGKILSDIADNQMCLRHLPASYSVRGQIDAARFVMVTAAFEWEFKRLYPLGIPKEEKRKEAEERVSAQIKALKDSSHGKEKEIYKSLLRNIERFLSLENKIEIIGKDYSEILDIFGKQLYELSDMQLSYSETAKRLGSQRNDFAHGNLDHDFKGEALLDIAFLERIVYAMQLKVAGVENKKIQSAINNLFGCRLLLKDQ